MALRLVRRVKLAMVCEVIDDEGDIIQTLPFEQEVGKPTAENLERALLPLLKRWNELEASLRHQQSRADAAAPAAVEAAAPSEEK